MSEAGRPGSRVRPLSVYELNEAADAAVHDVIGPVWIAGELSRFTPHRSGHWYFTVRDERAAVDCAMFRGRNQRVRFKPEVGMEVLVLGTPGVYAPQGRYQLVVESMEPGGRGAAALALERLKAKLAAEGLFAEENKKPIPAVCRRIGVATSATGAAVRDVLRVLRRRFASVQVLVAPTSVQGERAPAEIVAALAALDRHALDVVLLVRGGGAREDLAAFDTEVVVRAIAATGTPVVTGIGHEIDTTLADLAADLRAPTPSAAAEIVVREQHELLARVRERGAALSRAMRYRLRAVESRVRLAHGSRALGSVPMRVERARWHLADLSARLERAGVRAVSTRREALARLAARLSPDSLKAGIERKLHRVEAERARLSRAAQRVVQRSRDRLARLGSRLDAMSPLAVLDRGYALARHDADDGPLVRDAATLERGDTLFLRFAKGRATAEVRTAQLQSGEDGT